MNNQQINLKEIIDLVWLQGDEPNDYLSANTEVLRMVEASNSTLKERQQAHRSTGNKQIYDPFFPGFNANGIPNTHYVAAEGPNDIGLDGLPVRGCLARFFENTVFNHDLPIKCILAIGHYGYQGVRGDFAHYFEEGTHSYSTADESSYYLVKSRRMNTVFNEYELLVENPSGSLQTAYVTWLPLADLQPLPTDHDAIMALAHVYHLSRVETVLIHCAAGIGRTGAAILTFAILDHYSAIFADIDSVHVANQIRERLNQIRTIRPAFVTTKKQLGSAVQCAMDIYLGTK